MAEITLENGRVIGDFCDPYIIAEVNSSHNGSVETAKEMIVKAKECGCDCVKFQSWSPESLYSEEYYQKNPIARKIVRKFSLSPDELLELNKFCSEQDIDFSSTPYSEDEVDFLVEDCQVPFIKIASMEINHFQFLEYIAKKGVPMVLSTGMSDMDEIRAAVDVIERTGNKQLCLLHCVSVYPAKTETIRLKNIAGLRKDFPEYPIGFSDHTLGITMDIAATAMGTAVIEKHFTLDKCKMGMDNNMALEPAEYSDLVTECRETYIALGTEKRVVLPEEMDMRQKMRRSVVAARDLSAGEVIGREDLECKRPGDGVPPNRIDEFIGKTLNMDLKKGFMI